MTDVNTSSPDGTRPPESVRRRYLVTISSQFIQFAAGLLTVGIVPRALGPANFGNYSFLLATAATIRGFLSPSTEQSFFTFSSQERRSGGLTKLYALILFAQVVVSFAFIGIVAFLGKLDWLWMGQALDQILLVTLLEWTVFIVAAMRQLGDSKGLTVRAQVITLVTSLITLLGLLGLNAIGLLNLYTYIALNMFSAVVIGVLLIYWLIIKNANLTWVGKLGERVREYIRHWWRFAAPLIMLGYYMQLIAYLSTYLVQRWYGSVEQGYFSLASRWSALVLVFTSSALMIIWREIAHAMAAGDHERAGRVYLRFNQLLFFLTLVLCAWLSFSSQTLVATLAGGQYQLAVPVLAVMAFYPLQQTHGQLNTAALIASERTIQVRNLNIVLSIPDLLLTYFLLAPATAPIPGLGLGAIGVALRMVVYGLLSVQAYEWASHRIFGMNYFRTLGSKLGAAAIVGLCALATLRGMTGWLQEQYGLTALSSLGIGSIVYFGVLGAVFLLFPGVAGVEKKEAWNTWQAVINMCKKIFSHERSGGK